MCYIYFHAVDGIVESKPSPAQSPARLSRRLGPSPSNLNSPSHKLRNSTDTPALIKVMFTGIAETAPLEKVVYNYVYV